MLVVTKRPYRGRFHEKAVGLVKSGVRVGQCYVSGEDSWRCHVCSTRNPGMCWANSESGSDHWTHCEKCNTPFIIIKA